MLTLLVGTPGSGKTLFAIDKVIKIANSELDEFKKIEYVYTNISGFDFDKFKDNKVVFDRFVFNVFYQQIKELFLIFCENENQDNLDDLLQEYCKNNNILNAYFIIDEAHNFFDNQDKVKMWWFTYHRHLNHEILLITQNKSLINIQYRNIPEIFVKAQPRSKAISENVLRYFNYTEYRMTQKFSTTEITINKSYFDIYKSGNKSSQKLVGKKYIIMFIIFLLALILLFSFFIYKLFFTAPSPQKINEPKQEQIKTTINTPVPQPQIVTQSPNNAQTNQIISPAPQIIEATQNLKLFKFSCFEKFCYYTQDNKNTIEIPLNMITSFIKNIDEDKKFFYMEKNRLVMYLLVDENKFNFLKGVQDENDKKGADILLPNIGISK